MARGREITPNLCQRRQKPRYHGFPRQPKSLEVCGLLYHHESGGYQIHEADGTVISPVSEIDSQTRHKLK
jgi:hypothetical protein